MSKGEERQRNTLLKKLNGYIEYLKEKGAVDAEEFRGFDKNLEDDEVCYSDRELLRSEYETTMDLPYSRIELYSSPTFGYRDSGIKY